MDNGTFALSLIMIYLGTRALIMAISAWFS